MSDNIYLVANRRNVDCCNSGKMYGTSSIVCLILGYHQQLSL